MQLTVRTINWFGFVFWIGLLGLLAAMFGMPKKLHFSTFLTLMPLPYFLMCIATSYVQRQSNRLLTIGVIAHCIIASISIIALVGENYWPSALFILYATAWFLMYFQLPKARNLNS
jgi:hypothetical protein